LVSAVKWKSYLRSCAAEKRQAQRYLKLTQSAKIGWKVIHQLNFNEQNLSRWKAYLRNPKKSIIPPRQTMLGRYIGIIDKDSYNPASAGKLLLQNKMKKVWQQQIEKWFYCVDDFFDMPVTQYSVFPFFALLKVLLLVGRKSSDRYSITNDEFRFFVVTIKEHDQSIQRARVILDFRKRNSYRQQLEKIFGKDGINFTSSDRIINILEKSDYLVFSGQGISLRDSFVGRGNKIVQQFEYLLDKELIPTYRSDKKKYFDMLYSEKNIFEYCSYNENKDMDRAIEKMIKLETSDRQLTSSKEAEFNERADKLFQSLSDPEERRRNAIRLLNRYQNATVTAPKLSKKMVARYERGIAGRLVKELHGYKCQIPSCRFRTFMKRDGSLYAEAHHLESLHDGGLDIPQNIICVCANHHRMFHYADVKKLYHDRSKLVIELNGKRKEIAFMEFPKNP